MNKQQFTETIKAAVLDNQSFDDVRPHNSKIKHQASVCTVWRNGDVVITYNSTVLIDVDGEKHAPLDLSSTFGYKIEGVEVQDWMYGVCSTVLDYTWNYDDVYAHLLAKQ